MYGFILNGLPVGGLMFAFRESTLPGQLITVLLFVSSIFAWSIMVSKGSELKKARRETEQFLKAYRAEGHPVGLFLKRKLYEASPAFIVYAESCRALGAEIDTAGVDDNELFMGHLAAPANHLSEVQIKLVRNVAERTVADQVLVLEKNMGFLATAVSASPFLGLLGTVWGVMDAFAGMAVSGAATLSAVAPGVSGALLTTVVGLFVALPSVIGYNFLASQIRGLTVQMDNFSQEFAASIERTFGGH